MKHILLFLIALFGTTAFSFAQSYTITPNDTFEVVGYMEDLQTLTISQANNTNDTLYFKWRKVSEVVPANWEASVCDNAICYTVLKDSSTTNPVAPGESGFILLHVTPHVTYGTSIVKYAIWDITNPALKDTMTFITTVLQPSGITEATNSNTFSMFPNPVSDVLNIQWLNNGERSLSVYNTVGERIYTAPVATGCQLLTTSWANGVYTVSFSDNNGTLKVKKLIIQH